jgi:hypothetical protein
LDQEPKFFGQRPPSVPLHADLFMEGSSWLPQMSDGKEGRKKWREGEREKEREIKMEATMSF